MGETQDGAVLSLHSKQTLLSLLRTVILILIVGAAVSSRLFAVVRYESIIHEFDPWFNYRATKVLTKDGYYRFWNWFDPTAWYPLGRAAGGTVFPGLAPTSSELRRRASPAAVAGMLLWPEHAIS